MMKNKDMLGLYFHIPFCVRKCNYCDFLSFPDGEEEKTAYVRMLVQEMELRRDEAAGCDVETIFIGGGTPSVLSVPQMDLIFQGINENFSLTSLAEFTIECNPGTVTGDKLRLYRDAGVSRISIGLQSAVEEELLVLGRIHTFPEFLDCYEMVRAAGFDNVNVDIMSAVPGQTLASCEKTLQIVTDCGPEHISSYSLIIEEGTPFYERYAEESPVDEETDRLMYERTEEILAHAGYHRYEISNYARQGRECRHNLKYWRREAYLGFGLGAASFTGHCRFSNTGDRTLYEERIRRRESPAAEKEELTLTEEMAEFMFLGLRCMEGVSASRFAALFGEDIHICFGGALDRCLGQGLLEREGDRIRLTKRGIDVSNRVFGEFV